MDFRDLYVFENVRDAEHRFPQKNRPPEALITDARSLNNMPQVIYGFRIRHAYVYAPINEDAARLIDHRQHRTSEPSQFYGYADDKPPLPVAA